MTTLSAAAPGSISQLKDLFHHPGILAHMPALKAAFDADLMAKYFEQELSSQESGGIMVLECIPDKAIIRDGPVCTMQYFLRTRHGKETSDLVVNSRVYPDRAGAVAYADAVLDPMLVLARRHPQLQAYKRTAGLLGDLPVTYAIFPLDGENPVLLEVTRPESMLPILQQAAARLDPSFQVQDFTYELAHYGRYGRCVLRYRLQGLGDGSHQPDELTIFGKVDVSRNAFQMIPVTEAFQRVFAETDLQPFRIPQILAFLPDYHMLLMSSLPGEIRIKELVRRFLAASNRESLQRDPALESTLAASAGVAAAMHRSGLQLGRLRTLEIEINQVRQQLELMSAWMPDLWQILDGFLSVVEMLSVGRPALPLYFGHGDFRYSQLLFAGQEAGLVDFDTVCQAEPALDLGQFLAYQRLTLRKEQPAGSDFEREQADALAEQFLKAYLDAAKGWIGDEGLLRERVALYEIISLTRMAAHSWQKLKGSRLQAAIYILQERIECLSYPS